MDSSKINFEKQNGLVPAIVQDATTRQVLMLGYMNKEAVERTLKSGKVTFYSRSRQEIWVKGETSGNTLNLIDIYPDCDNDTLLVMATPEGPTCHTGNYNCFATKKTSIMEFLPQLQSVIEQRKNEMPAGSYTTSLFEKGIDKIAQKVGEEAVETVIEAKNTNDKLLLNESADLIFHLMVLLSKRNLSIEKVEEILITRHK
ncbi:bifunctional phosphoribosyl-AMP cyclohydrolase/phosphoribosyl-ATP diphosphatase HisIE [Salinivirga cyanobacteriivorans]|uniref:Histidine biosynthesis bifunctional protein HisIE n=1 Tax=Salinivirga cyanobacteriivorans TaxID=1307839 RepID=A0A0S2HZG7_9BACT|nr:bifunctional phosphoribosyl-AMP cyclohydrolase/phosphoribosyl-ATP diphosphatase HisIE [Salinivirga cyanobacteriivorans]ALO15389.1 Phosphoribosyl-ATP pyrophosphatase [Salinivirga cyanobacteriivorans]